jgi:hypothetical protein
MLGAAHRGWPEATVLGDAPGVGSSTALALLLTAMGPAAAGEEDDTEESGDSCAAGCRALAVRIRRGAGVSSSCCFLDPRQSPSLSSSSSSSPTEFSSTSPAVASRELAEKGIPFLQISPPRWSLVGADGGRRGGRNVAGARRGRGGWRRIRRRGKKGGGRAGGGRRRPKSEGQRTMRQGT